MARPLLNYTTSIEAEKTVGEIQRTLLHHGGNEITTSFEGGRPSAISFEITSVRGVAAYRLPVKIDRVLATLKDQHQRGLVGRKFVGREQALRVGWRILKVWLDAQFAAIEAGFFDVDEVLLPYMFDRGRSFFEAYVEQRSQLEGPP